MDAQRFRQVRLLFEAALERPPEERFQFVQEASGPDSGLREQLEELVRAHETECQVMDRPAGFLNSAAGRPLSLEGRKLGAYDVVREIGQGGMGAVYLGERSIGRVRQKVAIKLLRPGWEKFAQLAKRFEHEGEILASLDHPNIARLLDVGTGEDGVPFLVMEYVEGEPLDTYSDRRRLDIEQRLRLFRTVSSAVHYAHSKGIVHRDLKPANILVAADGTVKLLDFGIAKLLENPDEALLTRTGMRPMTLQYASPEQIKGEAITPAADIFSLGTVLYESLTGRRPYLLEPQFHKAARVICEEPPVLPSVAVTSPVLPEAAASSSGTPENVSALRGETPRHLTRRLRGDLDSILMKTLRKEPGWRYTSAEALSEDIRRYLDGLPVAARRGTWQYRGRKAIGRMLNPGNHALHPNGAMMMLWGMFGALAVFEKQMIVLGWKSKADVPYAFGLMLVNLIISIRVGRRIARLAPGSPLDRQSTLVLAVVLGVLLLLTVLMAACHAVPEGAMTLFWSAGLAIAFLILGLQGSRLLTACAACLLASVVGASLDPGWFYGWLAAGLLLGVSIPGLALIIRHPEFMGVERQQPEYVTLGTGGPLKPGD